MAAAGVQGGGVRVLIRNEMRLGSENTFKVVVRLDGWLAGGHRSDRVVMDCAIHLDAAALDCDRTKMRVIYARTCPRSLGEDEQGRRQHEQRGAHDDPVFLLPRVTFEITLDCDSSRPPSWESPLRSRRRD